MNLNKLEKLEPYKEYYGLRAGSSGEEKKPLTKKERRLREKLREQYNETTKELPTNPNFEEGVRKAVKEIRSCYRLDNHMRISKELIKEASQPANYASRKSQAILSFYARIIGAIDKNIDNAQNWIDFSDRFKKTDQEEERRKELLLKIRAKVIYGFIEDTENTWIDSELKKALKTYPTHNYFGELYKILKDENQVKSDVVNLCIAYNEGYASDDLKPEKIEMIYNSGKAKLFSEKAINEGEYEKAIKRVRK